MIDKLELALADLTSASSELRVALMLVGSEVLDPIHTFGAVSLLDDGQSLLGTMGPRRFLLGDYPGLVAEGAHAKHNPNGDWALGVGVWGSLELPERRLFQPRAVICGNGIVQDDEECDACLLAEPEPEPEDPAMGVPSDNATGRPRRASARESKPIGALGSGSNAIR